MTSTIVRRNGVQPNSLAVIANDTATAIEQATASAVTAFNGATDGGSILAALNLAAAVQDLRELFSRPEIQSRIQALQDTPLGFRTDRDPRIKNRKTGQANTPYPYDVVQEAAIEGMLRGLQLVGNQFNIISGRFYCTKEGFEALIKKLDFVTDFRPSIGVPQTKAGGALVECTATWLQNGKEQALTAVIPVKGDDYSGADQLIGKASRKFLRRCYEVMSGNSMPEGEAVEPDAGVTLLPAPAAQAPTPALAASAAPVAILTEQQVQQVRTATTRQLTPVGVAAFEASICQACGVEALEGIPAELHTALMQRLADPANRDRWDRGCDHLSGEPILTADQIAELLPQEEEVEEPQQEEAPAPAPAPAATRRAAPATAPAVAAEPAEAVDDAQGELV
jgi:hypothetical protein